MDKPLSREAGGLETDNAPNSPCYKNGVPTIWAKIIGCIAALLATGVEEVTFFFTKVQFG